MLSRFGSRAMSKTKTSTPLRSFSSSLSSLLGRELAEEKGNCFVGEELEQLREKVLNNFKIHDTPGNMDIKLTGKFRQELIDIKFNCQDVHEEVREEFEDEEPQEEQGDDYDDDVLPCIRFTARIVKNNQAIIFDCVASSVLTVNGVMHLEENVDELSNDVYHGPSFADLEEDVQDAFADYLSKRHINDDLANFITQYADLKEQKEYVAFLETVQKFTEE
jgi:complement component 1 Q subcomponent-binding protein